MKKEDKKSSTKKGETFVWFSSMGLTIGLMMITGILLLIFKEGITVFWPKEVAKITLKDNSKSAENFPKTLAGEFTFSRDRTENKLVKDEKSGKMVNESKKIKESQYYVANRDLYKYSFRFIDNQDIDTVEYPKDILRIEREETSPALLYPVELKLKDETIKFEDKNFNDKLWATIDKVNDIRKKVRTINKFNVGKISSRIRSLKVDLYPHTQKLLVSDKTSKLYREYKDIRDELDNSIPGYSAKTEEELKADKAVTEYHLGQIKKAKELQSKIKEADSGLAATVDKMIEIEVEIDKENIEAALEMKKSEALKKEIEHGLLICKDINGMKKEIHIHNLVHAYYPNRQGFGGKTGQFFRNIYTFLWEDPREANTQGGVFPAIIGTLIMTILMCIFVTPFGVIAAIYLHEYAKQGPIVNSVRIAINNLAGVPSIVFGAFGLGFFVYFLGGKIDDLLYADWVNSGAGSVFKTGGILWASLTLALMTLPVVIVATEEALAAVPRGMREGAYGCSASKWQMIWTVVMPASVPGMITGMILAMARGAGEVAPLMLVGVQKSVSGLPIDSTYPFIHLDQKFMHLGFHIYDLGFQSPDSEAAKPMVFATTLLLILIVCAMNLVGIIIRQRLRKKYSTGAF